jgi:hypothetical protein
MAARPGAWAGAGHDDTGPLRGDLNGKDWHDPNHRGVRDVPDTDHWAAAGALVAAGKKW